MSMTMKLNIVQVHLAFSDLLPKILRLHCDCYSNIHTISITYINE